MLIGHRVTERTETKKLCAVPPSPPGGSGGIHNGSFFSVISVALWQILFWND
jgi:hypothetical protein